MQSEYRLERWFALRWMPVFNASGEIRITVIGSGREWMNEGMKADYRWKDIGTSIGGENDL